MSLGMALACKSLSSITKCLKVISSYIARIEIIYFCTFQGSDRLQYRQESCRPDHIVVHHGDTDHKSWRTI